MCKEPSQTNPQSKSIGEKMELISGEQDCNKNMESDGKYTRYKWYNINQRALPSKCAYFVMNARRVGFKPNVALFLIGIGLNKAETGFISGLG